jgi:hypothetical protein
VTLDGVDHRPDHSIRRERQPLAQQREQPILAEFLVMRVECLHHAVAEDNERVAAGEIHFADRAVPLLEESDDAGGRQQAMNRAVRPHEHWWQMAAVRASQARRSFVIDAEEQCRLRKDRRERERQRQPDHARDRSSCYQSRSRTRWSSTG